MTTTPLSVQSPNIFRVSRRVMEPEKLRNISLVALKLYLVVMRELTIGARVEVNILDKSIAYQAGLLPDEITTAQTELVREHLIEFQPNVHSKGCIYRAA